MKKIWLIVLVFGLILGIDSTAISQVIEPPNHDVFNRQHNENRVKLNYAPIREADVFWSQRIWREIDFRQKINHPFYYPMQPQNGRKSFMTIVWDAVKTGELIAYAVTPPDDNFIEVKEYKQLLSELITIKTTDIIDPNPPYGIIGTKQDTTYFDPSKVEKIRIKEDWFFDKQRSVMDVRILGICPVLDDIDPLTGDKRGNKPIFWIYFPQARDLFAKSPVYNRANDAKRLTYDDLFQKRMFASYIYKEQNVYDRKINAYKEGLDALLEAEKIKENIFYKEHDLWEF